MSLLHTAARVILKQSFVTSALLAFVVGLSFDLGEGQNGVSPTPTPLRISVLKNESFGVFPWL